MLDFSQKAVHEFWHEFQDSTIYKVISFMEGMEDWTLDGDPTLETALKRLEQSLDGLSDAELEQEEKLIRLVAHIKTGRGLRILMALDTASPGSASKVIMKAEEKTKSDTDIEGIFLRRNIVFERLRLLTRVFSSERFKLVLGSLEDSNYE